MPIEEKIPPRTLKNFDKNVGVLNTLPSHGRKVM